MFNNEDLNQITWEQKLKEGDSDFERRLAAFEEIGPKTVEIFMREAAGVIL